MREITALSRRRRLERRAAVAILLRPRKNGLVVAGLGNPSFDVAAAGDSPLNFYLWGAMGGAAMVGLGVALAQPQRRVLVVTGDGEMLMALGSLATIGCEKPNNLAIVVIDNEHYGETGMQPSHSGRGTDLAEVASATGFQKVYTVWSEAEIDQLAGEIFNVAGLLFAAIKVSTNPVPICLPPRDGPYLRSRFREAVLGPDAHRSL